ncbi:hypothetical protein [Emticicia sp. BO119]|uniref:hypothetical protein n=1 Tax=Emticicia sp. BO119 TaxID=2757768 RepID=UPI0015F0730C|nr:hypothetical protein [Emticicia sp. BO119]MBA4849502.1 hypothetical protein [Emticicia sp. BO119]
MINIGIIDLTGRISFTDMQRAIAAFQIQVDRDLFPAYGKEAKINYYSTQSDAPAGTWLTWIVDSMDTEGLNGYHFIDNISSKIVGTGIKGYAVGNNSGNPFGLVKYSANWTITCSHEVLEKLVNPYIKIQVKLDADGDGVSDEELLMEIADPVQANAYEIDGVKVSNFVYPAYYSDLAAVPGRKYDYMGIITRPKEIAEGGYFSFKRAGQWIQGYRFRNIVTFKKLLGGDSLSSDEMGLLLKQVLIGVVSILGVVIIVKLLKRKRNG